MKKLIFLFLLISLMANGQTTKKRWKALAQKTHLSDIKSAWGRDTSYISGSLLISDTILPKYDTTEVLMLVTDTSDRRTLASGYNSREEDGTIRFPLAYWIKGYEIGAVLEYWGGRTDYSTAYATMQTGQAYLNKYFSHVAYLSSDKKPLPAAIVVWMTKPLSESPIKYNGL